MFFSMCTFTKAFPDFVAVVRAAAVRAFTVRAASVHVVALLHAARSSCLPISTSARGQQCIACT